MHEEAKIKATADRIVELGKEVEAPGQAAVDEPSVVRARAVLRQWVAGVKGVVVNPAMGRVSVIDADGYASSIGSADLAFKLSAADITSAEQGDPVEAKKYYKILLFLKRRPGMTFEAFRDYYENHHAPLCQKYSGSNLSRYFRRYLTAHRNPETGLNEELPFDVITELWYEDEAAFRGTVQYLATSKMPDEIIEDERRLFDRPKMRMATVVECESASAK